MNKEFYEFLYNLRSSGFTHNTREKSQLIFYRNAQMSDPKKPFSVTANHSGEIKGSVLMGEIGNFAYDNNINYRNTIIGIAFALNMHAMDKHVDLETTAIITDYYIAGQKVFQRQKNSTWRSKKCVRYLMTLLT